MPATKVNPAIHSHLKEWGLRWFETDADYDRWQRETLKQDELTTLLRLSGQRGGGADPAAETAFYDYASQPHILPVLYSQRYDYYATIGTAVAERIGEARSALDAACGIGVLTAWYARQFPNCVFTGVDRSPVSIAVAMEKTKALGLSNIRFECLDMDQMIPPGPFDLVISTQALLQNEQDPGVPSASWRIFERSTDAGVQADIERRTGLGNRLDRLAAALAEGGRLIACEKTRHLARRVPFQRALAARGFMMQETPLSIQYAVIEEVTDDGPLYVLGRGASTVAWDESPEFDDQPPFDPAALKGQTARDDEPLYENHTASAQQAWERLSNRRILKEQTGAQAGGRQMHVELGESNDLNYLYCANTFDQRQLVIVDRSRQPMLAQYYDEVVQSMDAAPHT
ncbi:MAG: class I SAM-dependent methyltransferase [Nitrospira sp.]|nr:class I SAM-dependent methyltransferase [Nitrospira sp.]